MQHAPMTLPDAPANGVTGGLDWAQDDHAVAVVDSAGRQIQRFAVAHNAAGLRELVAGRPPSAGWRPRESRRWQSSARTEPLSMPCSQLD